MPRYILTAIGLMSGTSKDGIDAVLMETDGNNYIKIIIGKSIKYDPIFSLALRVAEYSLQKVKGNMKQAKINFDKYLYEYIDKIPKDNATEEVIDSLKKYLSTDVISIDNITKQYTILCSNLIDDLRKDYNISVDIIGDHGVTLYHDPKNFITIQIANGQLLADLQHVSVINDFRINDVKNGGQGAPLAPIYHLALLDKYDYRNYSMVNLGGTANITLKNSYGELIGFDTGPANVFLDKYIREYSNGQLQMDEGGKNSLLGTIIEELFANLIKEAINYSGKNYLAIPPPKSLCISNYNDINSLIKEEYNFNDVCATLSAFTSYCVIKGIELTKTPLQGIITCGGGSKNLAIVNYLEFFAQRILNASVKIISADEIEWLSSQYIEAELLGYLAVKSLHGDPITFSTTTGCIEPTKGGYCYITRPNDISKNTVELLSTNHPYVFE